MITSDEIKNLAHLARIAVTDKEVDNYAQDFEAILGYVDQINQFPIAEIKETFLEENKARLDSAVNVPGEHTAALAVSAPDYDGSFYKVPKILSNE
jgi:aspartyl-tRNA(Asn)/glutamyl-tRNA(Gln) amidotransferase subunit C